MAAEHYGQQQDADELLRIFARAYIKRAGMAPYHVYEHEKNLGIRIKRSKGEEHRKIDVVRSDACRLLGDKIDHHALDDGEQNTGEDEYIKSRRAPLAFERAAYPVIKIEKQQRPHARILRNEHKRDKAPYLPF